jgi:hypothetical protein
VFARSLIPVLLRLERAVFVDAEIVRLVLRQLRQLHAQLVQMQPRDLLVEMFRQRVDLVLVLVLIFPGANREFW